MSNSGGEVFLAYVFRLAAVFVVMLLAVGGSMGVFYLYDAYIKPRAMAAEACVEIKKERALKGEFFDCEKYLGW